MGCKSSSRLISMTVLQWRWFLQYTSTSYVSLLYHPSSPFITLHHPSSPFISLYHPSSPFIPLYHPSSPFITLHLPSSPFLSLHLPSSPFINLLHPSWTYQFQINLSSTVFAGVPKPYVCGNQKTKKQCNNLYHIHFMISY